MTHSANYWVKPMTDSDRYFLKEIITREQQENAPRSSPDKYFEFFCSEQILKKHEFDLDPEETRSGILGGSGDGGIDAIYLFANRRLIREDDDLNAYKDQQISIELIIVQSKYKNSFSETSVEKLRDFTEKCLRMNADAKVYKKLYNSSVLEAAERFRDLYKISLQKRPTLSIIYIYGSLADNIDEKVSLRAENLKHKCKELFSLATVEFEFIGASELFSLFNRTPIKTLTLKTSKAMPSSSYGTAYVCLVPLRNFYEFITENGSLITHIFESNIRAYQGEVTVNREIAETLLNGGQEEFWWLNNGVTIIASKVIGSGDDIAITDPLIVNGLQTSYKIHFHFQNKSPDDGDNRTIMVRVLETTNPDSIEKIIRSTNSQTKIERIYLHATEDVHRKIEQSMKSADLYYDRRKNYYRSNGVSSSKIVTLPHLAQIVAAILLQKPDGARARPTTIADKTYVSLFSNRHPVKLYVNCVMLMKRLEEFLDSYEMTKPERNNIVFHTAMYLSCKALKMAKPKAGHLADMRINDIDDDLIDECIDTVRGVYHRLGADDRVAKGPRMSDELKRMLESEFIDPLRVPRVKQARRR